MTGIADYMKRSFASPLVDFLSKNISIRQTVFKNTFWLGLAQGLAGIAKFFLAVAVVRAFGASEYGKFAFAFSFASLFSTFFDFGLFTAVTREFTRDGSRERIFPSLLALRFCLGGAILAVVLIASPLITSDGTTRNIMLILGLYIFTLELLNLFYALLRARQRMEIEAALSVANIILLGVLVLSVLYLRPSILNLSCAYVGSNLVILAVIFAMIIIRGGMDFSFDAVFNMSVWKEFILIGFYLALARGVGDITMHTDSVMLGYWGQITETGWYNAANKINRLLLLPMGLITAAIFPALIGVLKESKEKFIKYWGLWMKGMVFFSVLSCVAVLAKADEIIVFVYSKDFLPASLALKILAIMATLVYVHNIYFQTLLIFDQQKGIFLVMLTAAALNVGLNLILIPRYSLNGAAIATVAAHLLICILFLALTNKHTVINSRELRVFCLTLLIAVISGVLMFFCFQLIGTLVANLFVSLLYGTLVYTIAFACLSKFVFFNKVM